MAASSNRDGIRESFTRQAAIFRGEDSPFAHRDPSALAWVEPLDDSMTVLDVACGAAHVAEQIAPSVRQVVGIDLTAALLALGAQRLRDAGVDNVLLQEGDAASLPFVDRSFDLVCCRTALHHCSEPDAVVAEMARVCRDGGRVAVMDMIAPTDDARAEFDRVHALLDPSHVAVLSEGEMARMLEEHVGPLTYAETAGAVTFPLDLILTEVADRDAVVGALEAEVDGGTVTGFAPTRRDGAMHVCFTLTTVHATRAA
jgi:SAM-dependent methyltransferase